MKNKNKEMEVEIEVSSEKEDEKGSKKIEEYEVESALEDFMRVAKHKKNPKLMEMLMGKAEEKKKAIESIDDLKRIYKEKVKESQEG